jgi:hypothetical protein
MVISLEAEVSISVRNIIKQLRTCSSYCINVFFNSQIKWHFHLEWIVQAVKLIKGDVSDVSTSLIFLEQDDSWKLTSSLLKE